MGERIRIAYTDCVHDYAGCHELTSLVMSGLLGADEAQKLADACQDHALASPQPSDSKGLVGYPDQCYAKFADASGTLVQIRGTIDA